MSEPLSSLIDPKQAIQIPFKAIKGQTGATQFHPSKKVDKSLVFTFHLQSDCTRY